jgi:hypothetical protein
MSRIGILFCAYHCDHSIDEVLKPWIEVKQCAHPDQFLFSFSYGQFKEYADLFGAAPIEYPAWYEKYKTNIDFFQLLPPLSEAENRNAALKKWTRKTIYLLNKFAQKQIHSFV